jgi:hypothetical protein
MTRDSQQTFEHAVNREVNENLRDNTSSYVNKYSPAETGVAHQMLTARVRVHKNLAGSGSE